jgi:hypothetical protein
MLFFQARETNARENHVAFQSQLNILAASLPEMASGELRETVEFEESGFIETPPVNSARRF